MTAHRMIILACLAAAATLADGASAPLQPAAYASDGRMPLERLLDRYDTLVRDHGWHAETVYAYPGEAAPAIRAWRTAHRGPALWILAGIHGEEPAGPNAIAASLGSLAALAADGVPVVLLPLCNPVAYRHNWRYPNTAERDWRRGGYSVGDAEYLLPDVTAGDRARAAAPPGPDTRALTEFVLRTAEAYPPLLVLDLHEDELSNAGGYVYSQGRQPDDNPVVAEVVRLLQSAGMPLRASGRTRFGEPIVSGVVSRDDQGLPIRDGSIDELLAATHVIRDARRVPGPGAPTVIVVETPAFAGSRLEWRVAAHGAVLAQAERLWRLNRALPGGD